MTPPEPRPLGNPDDGYGMVGRTAALGVTADDVVLTPAAEAGPEPGLLACPIDGQPAGTLSGNCGHAWSAALTPAAEAGPGPGLDALRAALDNPPDAVRTVPERMYGWEMAKQAALEPRP